MDYQEILIYAGKREKDTSEYYQSLSKQFEGSNIGRFFNALSAEELKHKYKIEKLYDEEVLKEE